MNRSRQHAQGVGWLLAVLVGLIAIGCGGQVEGPSGQPDGQVDGATDSGADSDETSLVPPECRDPDGGCSYSCLRWATYADTTRNCYENSALCAPEPQADAGHCPGLCSVNLADGTIIVTCVPPSPARWRPCTDTDNASLDPISQECPPPMHGQAIYY